MFNGTNPLPKRIFSINLLSFLFALLWSLSPSMSFASQPMEQPTSYPITHFEYIEDARGVYDFTTILSSPLVGQFQHYNKTVISFGITKSVYWIRFYLPHNNDDALEFGQLLQLNNPNIDKIDLFLPVADYSDPAKVRYVAKTAGVSRPSATMDIRDNTWVFPIPQQIRKDHFLYLRLESTSALRLPMVLRQSSDFISETFLKNMGFGIFFGILLSMFLYNLFIFFVLRDKAYLFYILYICFMFIYQFQVHGYLKLWVTLSYPIHNAIFWLCLSAAFISAIYFTSNFLQVTKENSHWDKILKALVGIAILQGALGVSGYNVWANQIAHGLGLGGPLLIIGLAAFRFHQGFKPARYYLLAWGILSVGIIIWVLAAYIPDTFSAATYLLVATASEAILLSFALSDRFRVMLRKESALKEHIQYYRDLSLSDALTGLYNKRHFTKKLLQEVEFAHQNNTLLSLLMIDIDHFKAYNDQYGHWAGDQVLIRFGESLLTTLENGQLAFRYGGEELVVLVPNANCKEATLLAERIRQKLLAEEFTPDSDIKVSVSVSIGATELTSEDTPDSLFQRADTALYKAKETGRNQVCME